MPPGAGNGHTVQQFKEIKVQITEQGIGGACIWVLTQQGREQGIRRLMSINLLKRLESSVYSFNLTLTRICDLIISTIKAIDDFEKYGRADMDVVEGFRLAFNPLIVVFPSIDPVMTAVSRPYFSLT